MASKKIVLIDNGSGSCRAGFAETQKPSVVIPSVVGKSQETKDVVIGDKAQSMRETLSLSYPIERGIITNWGDMEKIWHHIFYKELGLNPSEHPTLLTEVPLNSKANREKAGQIMFETFNVPSLFLAIRPVMASYSTGRLDSVVLDSGYGVTHVVPVKAGYAVTPAIRRLDLAGADVTNQLQKLLSQSGQDSVTNLRTETVNDLKEKRCYVALNYEKELTGLGPPTDRSYTLPDGKTVNLGPLLCQAPEIMFQPSLHGVESKGVHTLIQEAISQSGCDRQKLYNNVVLSGSNTLFDGFKNRLQKELRSGQNSVEIIASDTRDNAAYIGSSTLAALSEFSNLLVSRKEYQEKGAQAIFDKCP